MPSNKRFLGGLMGANPLRSNTETVVGDSNWNDVVLLLDGSSTTDDLSTANNDTSIYVNTILTGGTVSAGSIDGTLNVPYLEFNSDDGLAIPTTFDLSGGDWTIEMWAYFDTLSQYKALFSSGKGSPATGIQLSLDASPNEDTLRFISSGTAALTAAKTISAQTWHHVALSYVASGPTLHLFVDGVGASSTSSDWATDTSNYLGGPNQDTDVSNLGHILVLGVNRNNNQAFDGRMTAVRATKGVARYTSYFTRPTPPFPAPGEAYKDPGNVDRVTANVGVLSLDTAGPEDATLTEYTLADYTAYSETQLTASNNNTSDRFGCGCDISGDGTITVFGAPFEDGATNTTSNSGAVYVYENGTEVAILRAASPAASDSLGFDVAISKDGSTIVASAYQGDSNDGEIYVFEKPANGWADGTSSIILTHTPDQTSENLGITLAISDNGDTVVAGTRYGSTANYNAEAFVFEKPSGGWASMTTETAKLSAASAAYSDNYSYGLAISGDGSVIAVGAPEENGGQTESGTVYLYDKPSGGWVDATETHLLSAPSRVANEHFGQSCSLNEDGTLLVVGADGHSTNRGRVHVFEDSSGTWSHKALLTSTDTSSNQHIGMAVAVSRTGTTVAASAPGYNSDEGAIYVWMKPSAGWANGTNDFLLTAANGSAANNDELGGPYGGSLSPPSKLALDTDGGKVVTSSVNDDDTNVDSGSGFLFAATTTVPSSVSTTTKGSQWFWGGMRGRNAITADSLVDTGTLSLSEMLQGTYSSAAPESLSFVGASYERSTSQSSTKTFTVPSGAQAGDVLIAISIPSPDTYISSTSDQFGAAEGEYYTGSDPETELDGWRWQGGTSVSSGNFGDSLCYGRVLDAQWNSSTSTSSWTITWNNNTYSTGVILAFRPSSPITAWEKTANNRVQSTGALTNTISTPSSGNADVAVGPRLYLYLLSGTPDNNSVENPVPTFPANEGWVHVDGSGEPNGQMDFAYKFGVAGDAFIPTTITTTDTGHQLAHLYCFTFTTS